MTTAITQLRKVRNYLKENSLKVFTGSHLRKKFNINYFLCNEITSFLVDFYGVKCARRGNRKYYGWK